MLPQINKILYATDLSESAKHAFNYAALLADRLDAEIAVLHVIDDISWAGKNLLVDFLGEDKLKELKEHKRSNYLATIKTRIEDFCEESGGELKECKFMVRQTLIREGNPAEEILEEAHKGDYDMVVIGTHGLGMVANALMGDTARRVMRRCLKPVTVIRLPE